MESTFICKACGIKKPVNKSGGTGYGINSSGQKTCYDCIGKQEAKMMTEAEPGERFTMYLLQESGGWVVTNWPGTLKCQAHVSIGRHNIAGKRYDAHFWLNGSQFWGVTYGDMTQICHVKKLKQ